MIKFLVLKLLRFKIRKEIPISPIKVACIQQNELALELSHEMCDEFFD